MDRSRRSAERMQRRAGEAIPQLPQRVVRNPYPPMALLSDDQVEAIHAASLRILEDLGIEVMNGSALDLLTTARAEVDRSTRMVRLDRGLVAEALATAPQSFALTPRNPA
ncbi:trimethylamine methyltransferase family protein, partial [Rhizobiaceae sp. 2RAB30]